MTDQPTPAAELAAAPDAEVAGRTLPEHDAYRCVNGHAAADYWLSDGQPAGRRFAACTAHLDLALDHLTPADGTIANLRVCRIIRA